jgi:hypothetical protein
MRGQSPVSRGDDGASDSRAIRSCQSPLPATSADAKSMANTSTCNHDQDRNGDDYDEPDDAPPQDHNYATLVGQVVRLHTCNEYEKPVCRFAD